MAHIVNFFHIKATSDRNPGSHPVATIALVGDSEGVYATAAVAGVKDNFNKKIARKILNGRMKSDALTTEVNSNDNYVDILNRLGLYQPLRKKLIKSNMRNVDRSESWAKLRDGTFQDALK